MKILATIALVFAFSIVSFGQQNVGVQAQNFAQTSVNGENVELEKLKGKVVVITFWSTKCRICISEMPKLNKMVDKYQGQEVEFLAVTMNNQRIVEKFLKKKTFKYNILPNGFGTVLKYADRDRGGRLNMGFPAHFVVDKSGKVVLKTSGYSKTKKLDSTVGRLLDTE
ncbi:MAG: TlpA family protein disulfide reductase [Pyrinomonadaceae bacterium]|nr:TlpA family protein disulfide reductase [Pyrinomonadaceae bacterium]